MVHICLLSQKCHILKRRQIRYFKHVVFGGMLGLNVLRREDRFACSPEE